MYKYLSKQQEYVHDLPENIKERFHWYTGSGKWDIFNEQMRKNIKLSLEFQEQLRDMDEAFNIVPPTEFPIVVYKGKGSENVYSDKAFMSTTLLYEKAKRFSGKNCCILQITVSAGSKAIPLKSVSRDPDEEELLLDRDGHLAVTGSTINDKDNMKIIFATYSPKKTEEVHNDKQIDLVIEKFDRELVIERIIKFYEDQDPEFIDDFDIETLYSKQNNGRKISQNELDKIKKRLKIE